MNPIVFPGQSDSSYIGDQVLRRHNEATSRGNANSAQKMYEPRVIPMKTVLVDGSILPNLSIDALTVREKASVANLQRTNGKTDQNTLYQD